MKAVEHWAVASAWIPQTVGLCMAGVFRHWKDPRGPGKVPAQDRVQLVPRCRGTAQSYVSPRQHTFLPQNPISLFLENISFVFKTTNIAYFILLESLLKACGVNFKALPRYLLLRV